MLFFFYLEIILKLIWMYVKRILPRNITSPDCNTTDKMSQKKKKKMEKMSQKKGFKMSQKTWIRCHKRTTEVLHKCLHFDAFTMQKWVHQCE